MEEKKLVEITYKPEELAEKLGVGKIRNMEYKYDEEGEEIQDIKVTTEAAEKKE